MRLKKYINTDEFTDTQREYLIDAIDWKVLSEVRNTKKFLYHGCNKLIKGYKQIDRISGYVRTPLAMSKEMFEGFNNAFKDNFGWIARKGVFVISDEDFASTFGHTYIFFPCGHNVKYVWSPKIQDINNYFNENPVDDSDTFNYDDFVKQHYISTHLKQAITSGHEIMFDTQSYILIEKKYGNVLL